MRHIFKEQAPHNLSRFIERENPRLWSEIHTSTFYPHLYDECLAQLCKEQSNLSGYTEKPLPSQTKSLHIDHFRKRSLFPIRDYVFGWDNLLADEHNINYGADYKDNMISSVVAYQKLVNSVVHDPHHFFTYMENGHIVPRRQLGSVEREIAEYTISVFNLQHPSLVNKREEIIRIVRSYLQGGLTSDDLKACLGDYGFPSVVEYALQQL